MPCKHRVNSAIYNRLFVIGRTTQSASKTKVNFHTPSSPLVVLATLIGCNHFSVRSHNTLSTVRLCCRLLLAVCHHCTHLLSASRPACLLVQTLPLLRYDHSLSRRITFERKKEKTSNLTLKLTGAPLLEVEHWKALSCELNVFSSLILT